MTIDRVIANLYTCCKCKYQWTVEDEELEVMTEGEDDEEGEEGEETEAAAVEVEEQDKEEVKESGEDTNTNNG